MSQNDDFDNIQLIIDNSESNSNYGIMLPCEPASFGEFISKLLGKPQTIERNLYGNFKIDKDDVINTHHLIHQRISQQNESSFIQFTAKIYFSDDSSVEINTIDDFSIYHEIKKVNCTLLNLSWTYLIKFKGKTTPEKQTINITFGDYVPEEYFISGRSKKKFKASSNVISIIVQHTARSWGVDIESLLTSHLENFKDTTKSPGLIHKHRDKIGIITGAIFFACSTAGAMYTLIRLAKNYGMEVMNLANEASGNALLTKKIDYILNITSSGIWPRFILGLVFFMIIALIFSIALSAWVATRAESKLQSWILLTDSSRQQYDQYLTLINKNMKAFIISIIISIGCGIVGNIFFSLYFSSLI